MRWFWSRFRLRLGLCVGLFGNHGDWFLRNCCLSCARVYPFNFSQDRSQKPDILRELFQTRKRCPCLVDHGVLKVETHLLNRLRELVSAFHRNLGCSFGLRLWDRRRAVPLSREINLTALFLSLDRLLHPCRILSHRLLQLNI